MGSTTEIVLIIVMQMLHSITFGAAHIAMIRYISMQSAERVTKLQGLYFGLASCAFMQYLPLLPEWSINIPKPDILVDGNFYPTCHFYCAEKV
ncbi:Probable 3-phenylpropionic acid transporter [Mannheimia haemolytica]|uniref:Probable 3-phenylpropionic acid transporter n=1 Tax=Mannheimia haemolytica TaxID=75985 RepID=A0A378MRQ5_MANHA|nr:Probable 3-phenylpropionic acid transporter [Mannheimia haemolytica]